MEKKGKISIARVRVEQDDSLGKKPVGSGEQAMEKERNGYKLEQWEFNCSRARFRIAMVKKIGRDDRVIASYPKYERNFRPVITDSISEKLLKITCTKKVGKITSKRSVR